MAANKKSKIHPVFKQRAENYTKIIDILNDLLNEWVPRLGLEKWSFDTEFQANPHEECKEAKAIVRPRWEYQTVGLTFYLSVIYKDSILELENTVVHELCHCLIDQVCDPDCRRQDVESVVVNLARAFMSTKYKNKGGKK